MESCGLWSTLTLPTFTLPAYSLESSSITGPIARQGPHHSAQKSITVNLSEDITCCWKFESVNSAAMSVYFKSENSSYSYKNTTILFQEESSQWAVRSAQ